MARNNFVSFYDDTETPWVDVTGLFKSKPAPCVACGTPTHRYDAIVCGPVCDDGTQESCANKVWPIYERALN